MAVGREALSNPGEPAICAAAALTLGSMGPAGWRSCLASNGGGAPVNLIVRRHRRALCSNSAPRVKTAINRCRPTPLKRAFAPTNAPSVQGAWTRCCRMSAQTVVGALFRGQSGQRRIGKAIIFLATIRQAGKSGTSPSTPQFTHISPLPLKEYRRSNGRVRMSVVRLPCRRRLPNMVFNRTRGHVTSFCRAPLAGRRLT